MSTEFGMDKDFYHDFKNLISPLLNSWFDIHAEGLENIPEQGPVLIAIKHSSLLDIILVCLLVEREVYGISKAENLEKPLIGSVMRRTGAYPIDRDASFCRLTKDAVTHTRDLLEAGNVVAYAPEMSRFSCPYVVARTHPEVTSLASKWQNKKDWQGGEITHVLFGINYSRRYWWMPGTKISVKVDVFDADAHHSLDELAEAMGLGLAELSGLKYEPEKYDYYIKYAERLAKQKR